MGLISQNFQERDNMKKLILLLLTPLLFLITPVSAETTIPDRPANGIYDPNGYLDQSVTDTLAEFNQHSDTQIGIYVVDTLDGSSIEERANEVSRAWKIGHSDTNKGILFAFAMKDRKSRIETSNEAAVQLTDSQARIWLSNIKSLMRKEDYSGAVKQLISNVKDLTDPEKQAEREQKAKENDEFAGKVVAVGLVGILGIGIAIGGSEYLKHRDQLKRSQYDYDGDDRLTPLNIDFVKNPSWTEKRKEQYIYEQRLKRSQYDYNHYDALLPGSVLFVDNDSWTDERKEDIKRKRETYRDSDDDDDDYHSGGSSGSSWGSWSDDSSSSSSSWSSGDWGGGGFDGGGASGGW